MLSSTTIASSTTKPARYGQRHQRQIVETEAEQMHYAERADDRGRHGDARNRGRAHAPQKHENHKDHQHDSDHKSPFGVLQRLANGLRAIHGDREIDIARQGGDQARKLGLYAVDGVDDVRARLAQQRHNDARLSVDETSVAQVLDRVGDLRHFGKTDRRAVAIGDDKIAILCRLRRLIIGVDLVVENRRPRSRPWDCWRWPRPTPRGYPRARCRNGRSPSG